LASVCFYLGKERSSDVESEWLPREASRVREDPSSADMYRQNFMEDEVGDEIVESWGNGCPRNSNGRRKKVLLIGYENYTGRESSF
jgi:hypothetical protein